MTIWEEAKKLDRAASEVIARGNAALRYPLPALEHHQTVDFVLAQERREKYVEGWMACWDRVTSNMERYFGEVVIDSATRDPYIKEDKGG